MKIAGSGYLGLSNDLLDVKEKIYTRDIFNSNE